MKILVLNPNTSEAVTSKVAAVIKKIARPTTEAVVAQIPHGPEALESYYDESVAAPYILEAVKNANRDGFDAVIIAAFCDPALEAVKEISQIPVYGLEETAFSVALLLGNKFSILTEKKHKVSVKHQHVRKHGLESRFASVRPLNMGVTEIALDPEKVKRVGIEIGRKMIEDDGAEVIIMGCASMAGYSEDMERALGVPILDPTAVTFKVVEALTEIGIRHSKIGLYAVPAPKKSSTNGMNYHVPNLKPLLSPGSIAIVGASDRPGAGSIVLDNLMQLGFPGAVYPVNPKYRELRGFGCYPSLKDLPGPVDSVAILLGYRQVLPILEQAAAIGARAAWSLASGFAEAGPQGEALQHEVAAYAQAHDISLCGPNCIGVVNMHARAATYSTMLPPTIKAGHVGAVLQSGAVCLGIANSNRGIGFSTLISSGNEAALDNADYVSYLVDDPETHVIIAFIEGFKQPGKFAWAAERARQAGKPLLVVKVGRSAVAQRASLAHTGSLAGADAVHDAVFRKCGIMRLDSLDELLEAAELFLKAPLPKGRGVGLLTLSGGQIGLIGDLARGFDLHFPDFSPQVSEELGKVLPPFSNIANPLDAWGSGNFEETYPACMEILGRDEGIHMLAVSRDTSPGIAEREVLQSSVIVDAAAAVSKASGKPVVVFGNISTGIEPVVQRRADAARLPLLQGTSASLRAIEALIHYAEFVRAPSRPTAPSPVSSGSLNRLRADLLHQPTSLGEYEGKQLLKAYGIPVTVERVAATVEAAVLAAGEIGWPVAVKIMSPEIQHKTEAGGVVLNVANPDALRSAYAQVVGNARAYAPQATIEGVLVQEMVPPGAVEVIVGSSNDPEFGPVVVFGLGGIFVELLRQSVVRLAPVSPDEAHEMVAATRGATLLLGFRGRPASDLEALVETIVRVSHLAFDLRAEVAAVDVNPLMVLPQGQGVRAADALIVRC